LQKERLEQATDNSKKISGDLEESVQEHSKNALDSAKESNEGGKEAVGGVAENTEEKVAGVSSSSS
jgi:hypothetical protein